MGHYTGNRWRPLPAVLVQTRANIIVLPCVLSLVLLFVRVFCEGELTPA